MNGISIILKKELKRVFGDKKLVFSLFILPAIIMVALYGLMGFMMGAMSSDIDEHENIVYVVNADEKLKGIISSKFMNGNDVRELNENEFREKEADIRNEILNNQSQLIVYVEPDFTNKFNSYKKEGDAIPSIKLYYNSTENYSNNTYGMFVSVVLDEYKTKLISERIDNLEILNVYDVKEELIEKEAKAKGKFISMMLPYMMVIMLFAGAMSVGVDAIAGEKERGTMASMLLSPVKRSSIVAGKIISLMILSGLSAIVYVVSMMIAMPVMNAMGGSETELSGALSGLDLSIVQGLQLLAIMLTLVFLFVSIIALLAVRAKDVKTASTYISPVYIVVMVAGMLTMFMSGAEVPTIRYAIPVYGGAIAVKDLCTGELTAVNFLASIGGAIIVAIICTVLITKSFNDEKVMFNA
ncbi:MAG: ABC transporter permease [Lachnospiraceae bacterium]|nr:ABC transporter permease [Lachnospiraceae bacterium]